MFTNNKSNNSLLAVTINKIRFCSFVLLITACASNSTNVQTNVEPISKDSAKIAYLSFTQGFWQVWITDTKGSTHEQLTHEVVDITRISWLSEQQQLLVNTNDGKLSLLDINNKKKTNVALDSLEVFDAQASPDGKQIVYTATTTLQADNAEVWVANIDGTNKKKITNNTTVTLYPSWSRDATYVLFSAGSPGKNQELWKAFVETGDAEQLTISPFSSVDPNVSAAGKIIYSSDQTGYYNIWLLDEKQKRQQITYAKNFDAQPVWNKKGDALVFFRIANTKKQIWLHDLNSKKEWPVTPEARLSRGAIWLE